MEHISSRDGLVSGDSDINRMQTVLEHSGIEPNTFEIVPVGSSGYLLSRTNAASQSIVCSFDVDDTTTSTTKGMKQRGIAFAYYVKKCGLQLTDAQIQRLLAIASEFSLWSDEHGQEPIDHTYAGMAALDWMVRILPKQTSISDAQFDVLHTRLSVIKLQLDGIGENNADDPFRFDADKRKFILRGNEHRWSNDLEQIYIHSFVKTNVVHEVVDAMKTMGVATNVGLFTRGDPVPQLAKIVGSFTESGDLPIDHLFLAKKAKGKFLQTVADKSIQANGIPLAIARIFQEPSIFVLTDNSPKDLDSILSVRTKPHMPELVAIRYRLLGGFLYDTDWKPPKSQHAVIECDQPTTAHEIVGILLRSIISASERAFGPTSVMTRQVRGIAYSMKL